MPDRTIRVLLWAASVLLVAGSGGIVSASLWTPIQAVAEPVRRQPSIWIKPRSEVSPTQTLDVKDFQFVWGKRLQGPLVDPVPAERTEPETVVEAPEVPSVRLEATLLGTLVDSDTNYARAWLEYNGTRRMVSLGDLLRDHPGQPKVESIEHRQVVFTLASKSVPLMMPEPSLLAELSSNQVTTGEDGGD